MRNRINYRNNYSFGHIAKQSRKSYNEIIYRKEEELKKRNERSFRLIEKDGKIKNRISRKPYENRKT